VDRVGADVERGKTRHHTSLESGGGEEDSH
jgi:hypothetical protein